MPLAFRHQLSRAALGAALSSVLLGVAACHGDDEAQSGPLPSLKSVGGPEAVLLRFPRAGGLPRSYRWPAIDSAIWTGLEKLPAIDRLLAFDDGGGQVAIVAADGRAGRLDLRNGRVQLTQKPLMRAASADGWSLYGVNNEGRLMRSTPTAEWKGPAAQIDTLFALPGGTVILVSSDAQNTRFVRFHPPAVDAVDTLELPHVSALTRTVNGDRLYAETTRGVLAIDTKTWKLVAGPRTGKRATAIAPTPSGDRTLILNEDGKTIRVWDRYAESFTGTIHLPSQASDLRMDPLGRFVLARMANRDSALVVSIPVSRVVKTIATEWRSDLPSVAPDGSVLTLRHADVIAVDAETGAQRRKVTGGGNDIWMIVRWDGFAPRDSTLDAPAQFAAETPADSAAAAELTDSVLAVRVAALARERLDSVGRASINERTHTDPVVKDSLYTLSFATLLNEAAAKDLAKTIRVFGRQPRVVPSTRDGVKIFRVVLGPYRTKELAEAAGQKSGKPYWVFPRPAVTAADWRAAGHALGPFDDITVLLLIGVAPVPLAAVARGAASAVPPGRRVAVFDLAGAFGLGDDDGVVRALGEGRSLNALARPLGDGSDDQFLVPRGPGELDSALVENERWPKLVGGFRSTGALLILLVPKGLDGIGTFVAQADRAFRVPNRSDAAALEPWVVSPPPLDEAATAPEPVRLARVVGPTRPPRRRRARFIGWAVAAILITGAAGWTWWDRGAAARTNATARRDSPLKSASASTPRRDTLALPAIANPGDYAHSAPWGVELEATNDRTDANFRLAAKAPLPAGTVSPVLLGGDAAPWFKIVAGAYVDRSAAELLRTSLRQDGKIDEGAGVVARVPLALRLDTALTPATAKARAASYLTRGIAAYALQRDDGLVTVYTGAFATPEQAVLLLAELRSAGLKPDLAFRVGRTY